ncbi:MAG: tRNA (adenine-N1)-methyltransferase [Thermoplasmataceae archaeon]
MKTLIGKSRGGFLDEMRNKAHIGNETYDIGQQFAIREGDILKIKGNEFIVSPGLPHDFNLTGIRGAQIINSKDSAIIVSSSGIRQGSIVLESGIGSGALTTQIGRVIGIDGLIVGIDRDPKSEGVVRKNMEIFNIETPLEFHCSDINEYDFKDEKRKFDAVFLDMPEPWKCLRNLTEVMKLGSRLITYLPNYDQVEKTVLEMEQTGLYVFETFELIKRNILVRRDATRPDSEGIMHTAFITVATRKSGQILTIR